MTDHTDPTVVVQVFDERGFTHLRCALDLAAAEAEEWVAEVTYARGPHGGLHVDLHDASADAVDLVCDVARDELRWDHKRDLSYLTTHHYDADGCLVPNGPSPITTPLGGAA